MAKAKAKVIGKPTERESELLTDRALRTKKEKRLLGLMLLDILRRGPVTTDESEFGRLLDNSRAVDDDGRFGQMVNQFGISGIRGLSDLDYLHQALFLSDPKLTAQFRLARGAGIRNLERIQNARRNKGSLRELANISLSLELQEQNRELLNRAFSEGF